MLYRRLARRLPLVMDDGENGGSELKGLGRGLSNVPWLRAEGVMKFGLAAGGPGTARVRPPVDVLMGGEGGFNPAPRARHHR